MLLGYHLVAIEFFKNKEEIVKMSLSVIIFGTVLLLSFGSVAFTQTAVPDYSAWEHRSFNRNYAHNNQKVVLKVTSYTHETWTTDDKQTLIRKETVNVRHNENDKPWLLFYTIADALNNKREYYLFEYKNDQWVYVKDFSDSKDIAEDTVTFLRETYHLESE